MCELSFRNRFLSTDVFTTKFWSSYILVGVGGHFRIYDILSRNLIYEEEIFSRNRIHGICPGSDRFIIVYGSKDVVVLMVQSENHVNGICVTICASFSMDDWILTANWMNEETQLAIVTAHNVIWLWDWKKGTIPMQKATCIEKCILYSALIHGASWEDCVVFSGTVFQEVVVWMPAINNSDNDQPVLHRLKGHSGVIFSITLDCLSWRLCTTSDDRSVRMWEISFSEEKNWAKSTVKLSHVFFGHTARVWRSLILGNLIISIGEDSQVCVWNDKGELMKSWRACAGDCVWAADYSQQHELLVTGAGDGSIHLWPLSMPLKVPIAGQTPNPNFSLGVKANIRKVALLHSGNSVLALDDGSVAYSTNNEMTGWNLVHRDSRLGNYCVLAVSSCRSRFALASLDGRVTILWEDDSCNINKMVEQQVEAGKIWSVHWLDTHKLLICGNEGRLTVWSLEKNPEVELKCIARLRLPPARERWTTAAANVSIENNLYVVCGDRCGSLHLYSITDSSNAEYVIPCHSLPRLHGCLGVTSVSFHDTHILSTGRDGTLRRLHIETRSNIKLIPLSADKMVMDWVCGVLPGVPLGIKGPLIVGFKETHLLVWCVGERRTVLELHCGGGHRSWDCFFRNSSFLHIAFVREKCVWSSVWNVDQLIKPALLLGLHAHEVNCVHLLPSFPQVFATGGEDGTVMLTQLVSNQTNLIGDRHKLEHREVLTSHISSVRCMEVFADILFSAGGRGQMKAWRFERAPNGQIICSELASHMLKAERSKPASPAIDPEVRYMTVCCIAHDLSNDTLLLAAGCSDGVVRFFTFSLTSKTFQSAGESDFHGRCLLKISSLKLMSGQTITLSTATDGRVALWDLSEHSVITDVPYPFWSVKLHQSGVNGLCAVEVHKNNQSLLMLATGGDDNAITLSVLRIAEMEVSFLARWHSSSAHAAQVTGVWIIESFLVSVSVDQRISVWSWSWNICDPTHLKCALQAQYLSSVADIQDMQVWKESNHIYICVVGKGVQILEIFPTHSCHRISKQ